MEAAFRPKEPRVRDPDYMGWIAGLPCVACFTMGQQRRGVHVAHLRAASLAHDKRYTGKGEKPSDRWTLPLCPGHHMQFPNSQHHIGEERFWELVGVNPFDLCLDLNRAYDEGMSGLAIIAMAAGAATKRRTGQ